MKYAHYIGLLLLFSFCIKGLTGNTAIDDPITITEVTLGKKLFFDPVLSMDASKSCASCHQPQFAYADSSAFSLGVNDSLGKRNTPSVMNMASRPFFFHDGRALSLEDQVKIPLESELEMNLSFEEAVQRLNEDHIYMELFVEVYENAPSQDNIAAALSAFVRSLESDGTAPHDLWVSGIDTTALTASQQRGRMIFIGDEHKCFECHFGPDFTGDEFRNIGLYDELNLFDTGRFEVTKDSADLGRFKVPGLRNIGLTAPYMHNGMMSTLEEVIDYYSNPYDFVKDPVNMDTLLLEPLNFTDQQKQDLVSFLLSLTDENIPFRDQDVDAK